MTHHNVIIMKLKKKIGIYTLFFFAVKVDMTLTIIISFVVRYF